MKFKTYGTNRNQVNLGKTTIFFSYQTPVACHIEGQGYFRTTKKWSVTTSKHITQWLAEMGAHDCAEKDQEFFDNLAAN